MYDAGGELMRRPARTGLPVLRPKGVNPPCSSCMKIPPGAEPCPENAVTPTLRSRMALQFHRECRAVRRWPNDALVAYHESLIQMVRDGVEQSQTAVMNATLSAVMQGLLRRDRGGRS